MIINDLDGYYIVFDTKNWNTELDTLFIHIFYSSANIACFCNTECKFIVRFMLNYRVKTVLINKKRSSLRLYRLSFVYLRYAARYALKSSHGRTRQ